MDSRTTGTVIAFGVWIKKKTFKALWNVLLKDLKNRIKYFILTSNLDRALGTIRSNVSAVGDAHDC